MSTLIRKTVKSTPAGVPFAKMADKILGTDFDLSLVICADELARSLNREYRGKDYFPNVLSFPIDRKEGEIFLNVRKAEREARAFKVSVAQRVALLFVHGCFHLKGLSHGDTMEREEARILRAFGFQWHGASTPE